MAMEGLVPTLAKPVPEQVTLKEGGTYPTRYIANGRGRLAWVFNYLLVSTVDEKGSYTEVWCAR